MNPIGVMLNSLDHDRLRAFEVARELGFQWVHTGALPESWLRGPERERYVAAARQSGLRIDSMFIGFDGQSYANIPAIKRTVGLVIPEQREHRCKVAMEYCPLAAELGARSVSAHLGFIPSRMGREYHAVVDVVGDIADGAGRHGLSFRLETGQDAGAVLARLMTDVSRPNLAVNFDPANFIMYGSDDPNLAFEILGPQLAGFHCKDAVGSGQPGALGKEVPLGEGEVDLPGLLRKLGRPGRYGFKGPLIIEREQGSNKVADVLAARRYLEKIQAEL